MTASSSFEVTPLGTGNSFAARRYCTSLVLIAGEARILVDCPDSIFRVCAEASTSSGLDLGVDQYDHVILTHLHGDHCNGLEGLGFWRKFVSKGNSRPPIIHTTHHVGERLWQRLAPSMAEATLPPDGDFQTYELADYFDVRPFEFGDSFEAEGVQFETYRTNHSIPCFGFRARFGGRQLGYSCDTSYDPKLIEFLQDSDLIFHDCDQGLIHTPIASLEALPEPTRNKMRLIHMSDDFQGSPLIENAIEGKVYRV